MAAIAVMAGRLRPHICNNCGSKFAEPQHLAAHHSRRGALCNFGVPMNADDGQRQAGPGSDAELEEPIPGESTDGSHISKAPRLMFDDLSSLENGDLAQETDGAAGHDGPSPEAVSRRGGASSNAVQDMMHILGSASPGKADIAAEYDTASALAVGLPFFDRYRFAPVAV